MSTQDVVTARSSDFSLTAPDTHRHFRIRLAGVPVSQVEVESLESENHTVNGDYAFTVLISTLEALDVDDVLGCPATLALGLSPSPAVIHGVVGAVEDIGERAAMRQFRISLQSPLYRAARRVNHRVFRRRTAPEIAREVLAETIDGVADITVEAAEDYLALDMTVQNGETDLALVRRVLSRAGLCLVVRQNTERATVVIHDRFEGAGEVEDGDWPLPLSYVRPSGQVGGGTRTVHALRDRSMEQPARVEVRDFDPDYPRQTRPVQASSSLTDHGQERRLYGKCGGDKQAREEYAGLVQSGYDSRRREVEISTDNPCLAPGVRVTITGHPSDRANDTYVVVDAAHEGDQAAAIHGGEGRGRATYRCVARLVPVSVGYRDVPEDPHSQAGLLVGRVEGGHRDKADLDDEGAYRVRLALDQGDAPNADASPRVRLMQPYGGRHGGMHFPLQANTQVAIAGLNGDADRPVILGALPHAGQHPPVTTAKPHEHVLRTPAGHQLVMNDEPGRERLSLSGGAGAGDLSMSADTEQRRVALTTEEGDLELRCGQDMTVSAGGARTVEVDGEYTVTVGDDYTVRSEQGAVEWSAAGSMDLATDQGDLLQEATEGAATLRSQGEMLLDAGDGLTIAATGGDTVVSADAGALQFEAEGDLELTGSGDINIGGGLTIRENGDLVLEGRNIELNAGQITVAAGEINSN